MTGSSRRIHPRLESALAAQLDRRRRTLRSGAEHVGWKRGVGDRERIGGEIVVGHLTTATQLEPGATYRVEPGADLHADAEVALAIGSDIDADVVQVDEANVTGHPDRGPLAAEAINRVLENVRGEGAVHLCFGNYGGQTIQEGTYRELVSFLNSLEADHVLLELAHRPPEELSWLREIDDRLSFGVGVVDIKTTVVESADLIAERIEAAAKVLGEDRISYVNPDCGLWILGRGIADGKLRNLVRGRDLYAGTLEW
jgi:5-methyltetrahydropteroyltriglutamate--homocysteine methyltransferase